MPEAVARSRLLSPGDPTPVLRSGRPAGSRWLLLCDHAGNAIPQSLGDLGLSQALLAEHIAIDIGIWPVTGLVSERLGAEAIGQPYSRLVIDCNRQPGTPASIPLISDGHRIPGNAGLRDASTRAEEILAPYHDAISQSIGTRGEPPLLCSMHSFTRELAGNRRTVDVGVIHGPDGALADAVLTTLAGCGLRVGRNTPYQIDFAGDYTLPVHGEGRGLEYVEIEICQDLIGSADGQAQLAAIMTAALAAAQDSRS